MTPKQTNSRSSVKRGRKAGKIANLPAKSLKAGRAAAVKGGIITGAGAGAGPHVKVFDGKTN